MLAPHILAPICIFAFGLLRFAFSTPLFLGATAADATFTGQTVLVLEGLIGVICAVIGVWIGARRRPPIAEQLHQEFATKQELNTVRKEAADSVRRLHKRIDELIEGNEVYFREAERARGSLMAKVEGLTNDVAGLKEWLMRKLK